MAGRGTPLLRASAFAAAIDDAITIVAADDPVEELARRRVRVAASRGRDGGLVQREGGHPRSRSAASPCAAEEAPPLPAPAAAVA
jgi:hypothetical protein